MEVHEDLVVGAEEVSLSNEKFHLIFLTPLQLLVEEVGVVSNNEISVLLIKFWVCTLLRS